MVDNMSIGSRMVVSKRVGSSNGFSRRDASRDGMFLVANNRRVGSRMVGQMSIKYTQNW